ncbi:hypothetical protein SAMN04488516_1128 [Desulfonauticus submarinus]|uniref:Peptidase M50 domain-containing protein n=1 Tax=Desulfonauticus submarinus TaxID=206665 RepID=A0A1H0FE05_9BACT|nr:M50 family metallopeptidase [Desulfonauticus submarinus]SDN92903.1 hypothetical protein SAMN04488516_1128 [Desulfonauticus submarinus]
MNNTEMRDTYLIINPELSNVRKATEFVKQWAVRSGLADKILLRFLFAVSELIEAIVLFSIENSLREKINIEVEPWEGWIKVNVKFSAKVPIEPYFEHKESKSDKFPGHEIAPEVFWHRVVVEWVDKAEWTEIGGWKRVSFVQYARPSGSPGELYFLGLVPIQRKGVNIKIVGEDVGIVTIEGVRNAFRMTKEMMFILNAVDGKRNVREIYRLYVEKFGIVHPKVVGGMIEELIKRGILLPGYRITAKGSTLTNTKQNKFLQKLLRFQYSIPHPDSFVSFVHRYLGWLWSPFVVVVAFVLIFSSFHILVFNFRAVESISGKAYLLFSRAGGLIGLVSLLLLNVHIIFHELSHAVVCKRFGGRIHALGILFYYGFICAFADTTDSWAFPSRWKRIMVSFAGPLSDLTVSCIYGWAHIFFTRQNLDIYAGVCGLMSILLFYFSLVNMIPFFETDGYYILSDMLNIPNLRKKSWNYLKQFLFSIVLNKDRPKISWKEKFSYLIFGSVSLLCVGAILLPPILVVFGLKQSPNDFVWFFSCFFVVIIALKISKIAFEWYHKARLTQIKLK